MKTALIATAVGMLALCASSSVKAASTNCSDMSTIVTAADVDLCLKGKPALHQWKKYWKIDSEDNPQFELVGANFDGGSLVYSQIHIHTPFLGSNHDFHHVLFETLQTLDYVAVWREYESNVKKFLKKGQDLKYLRGEGAQTAENRWVFADDCIKALEIELSNSEAKLVQEEAAYEGTIRNKEALERLSVWALQKLDEVPEKLQAQRIYNENTRKEITRFWELRGALKQVEVKYRSLTLRSQLGPVGITGPIFTSLLESGAKF